MRNISQPDKAGKIYGYIGGRISFRFKRAWEGKV